MKNKEYKLLTAMAMTAALTVGSIGTISVSAKNTNFSNTKSSNMKSSEAASASDKKAEKDETVYAKIDKTGTVSSITISDQLRNVRKDKKINDVSSLVDIENVKGDETFSQKNNSLIWNGSGQDICYQGTTNQSLPVGITITYQLDGKEISPEDLEGKSGHLTIRYQYQNTTGNDAQDYVPFLMATGLILDEGKYTNVEVTNGKLLSDGDRDFVIGLGIPKMNEALGTDALDIPDFFELEADVTEYTEIQGMTIATNDLFNKIDTEEFDSVSDLKDAMKQLQDSSKQLVSGTGELKNGLDTLLSSSGTLIDGIDQLAAGSNTLKHGALSLADGNSQLALGTSALSDGTGKLLEGTKSLAGGAGSLYSGLTAAEQQVKAFLLPGVQALDEGVSSMQSELTSGIGDLSSGINNLDSGLQEVAQGTAAIDTILNQGTEATGGVSLNALSQKAASDAASLAENDVHFDQSIAALQNILSAPETAENPELQAALTQAVTELTNAQNSVNTLSANAASVAQEAGTISAVVNTLSGASTALNSGAAATASGMSQLNTAVNDPQSGLGVKINAGIAQLKEGTSTLRSGIEGNNGLLTGMSQLSLGADALNTGSAELAAKMKEADTGAKSAASGALQASSGAGRLSEGAISLYNGIGTLKSGSSALISGVQKLDDGAAALNEGMIQFDQEGIEKLVTVFDDDIDGLLDKANDMLNASKNYKSFSGISDDMDGHVKFIFI